MLTKNYTIISLYSTVFLVIGLLTAYFPLWLNQSLKLETKYIGYILSLSGILKVFFTLTITTLIKNNNYFRPFLLSIISISITLFLTIYSFKDTLPFYCIFLMVIFFLITFSPILPFLETLYSSTVKKPLKKYGKIRVSGSLAFCVSVFFFGYVISIFSVTIFPIILVACLIMLCISIAMISTKIRVQKYNSIKDYKNVFKKKNKNLLIFIFICSMLQATHAMYYGYSTIMWESKGLSFFKVGLLWSMAIAAEIILFLKLDKYFKSKFLFKTLFFCSIIIFIRWTLTYLVDNFYALLIVQTLHGVTFALTHYIMIFFINTKIKESSRLFVQSVYYTLTGGFFITILTISCGHITYYTKGDEGYLLMSLLALFSLTILYYKRKLLK